METSQANVAGIESGRPPSLETLERLAVALAAESRTGPAWTSFGGRWRWAGLAIAILVPALLILNGRSGETDRAASSGHLPEAASGPPAASAPVIRVDANGNPLRATPKEAREAKDAKAQRTKTAPQRQEGGAPAGDEPPRPAPNAALAPTSPAEPAPKPPSGAVSPQPSGSGGSTAPLQPTGKPDGSPGNGPGGGGGSGGSGSGGSGGNGPDGTGPPGQLR
jgi:hypothetical protein